MLRFFLLDCPPVEALAYDESRRGVLRVMMYTSRGPGPRGKLSYHRIST